MKEEWNGQHPLDLHWATLLSGVRLPVAGSISDRVICCDTKGISILSLLCRCSFEAAFAFLIELLPLLLFLTLVRPPLPHIGYRNPSFRARHAAPLRTVPDLTMPSSDVRVYISIYMDLSAYMFVHLRRAVYECMAFQARGKQ